MATIRRARGYLFYLFAILISGFLGLFGRSGPTWAQEAKREYNSRMFNEEFRVAAAQSETRYKSAKIGGNSQIISTGGWDRYFSPDGKLNSAIDQKISTQRDNLGASIKDKLDKDIPLTPAELNFLQTLENQNQIEMLRDQINVLMQAPPKE